MATRSTCLLLLLLLFNIFHSIFAAAEEVSLCGAGLFEIEDTFSSPKKEHLVAMPVEGTKFRIRLADNETNIFQPIRCSMRIMSCDSCVLHFKYRSPVRDMQEEDIRMMSSCQESLDPCFDLRFIEEKADTTLDLIYQKISIWDEPTRETVNSTSNTVVVMVTLWNIEPNSSLANFAQRVFPFTVTALSNEEFIEGTPSDNLLSPNLTSVGFIESPRYPAAYPRQLSKTYSLVNTNPQGFVRLIFDDFHIHFQSEIQIIDSDGSTLFNTKHENRRPPAFVSSGPMMTVKFDAHDFTRTIGFRARYDFVESHEWPEKPNSRNCDELFEGYGGEIKLDGNSHLANTYVDCIWIVGRFPHTSRTFDRIYLKVEEFHLKGVGIRLEVREGASSTSDRLMLLYDSQTRDQLEHKQPRQGFTTDLANPAYYIRLRGFLMGTTGLEIVYSQYYRWVTAICPGVGEYHCDNARCIKSTLRCDSVDHCGDGSDELCTRPISDLKNSDSDVSGLIALVIGVCGLIILLIATTSVMARVYRRRISSRLSSPQNPRSPYGNEMAPSIQTIGERRFYVVPENQLSVIEAPPSYDDALKHPAVRTSCYTNRAFTPGSIEERALSPAEPPPALEDEELADQPSTSQSSRPTVEAQAEQEAPEASTSAADEPSCSQSENHEESWV